MPWAICCFYARAALKVAVVVFYQMTNQDRCHCHPHHILVLLLPTPLHIVPAAGAVLIIDFDYLDHHLPHPLDHHQTL